MAKVSLDLNQFKANGVYTVEYDATETTVIDSQQLRLIVGFSRKGPFNAPVFLKDSKASKKIFGEIDTLLEKRGSFFHRSIETALKEGPVYAINLLPLDNTPTGDKIEYRSFSLSMDEENAEVKTELYASFYNKERFWKPDTSYFDAIVNNDTESKNRLISFTNLSQTPISLLVRKAKDIKGFDITARDFYGDDSDIPAYVKKFAYIRDYFIDIYAVKGDWTDYENLSIDPDYSKYFTTSGVKVDALDKFLASEQVSLIGSWTGCIIPDFTDRNGTNQYIETIVNSYQELTGIYMTINREMLDDYENSTYKVDLIGNSLIENEKQIQSLNVLSYVSPITDAIKGKWNNGENDQKPAEIKMNAVDFSNAEDAPITPYIKSVSYSDERGHFNNTIVIPKPRPEFAGQEFTSEEYNALANTITNCSLIQTIDSSESFVKVDKITNTGSSLEIGLKPGKDVKFEEKFAKIKVNDKKSSFTIISGDVTSLENGTMIYFTSSKKYSKVTANEDGSYKISLSESEASKNSSEYLKQVFTSSEAGNILDIIVEATDYSAITPNGFDGNNKTLSVLYKKSLIEAIEEGSPVEAVLRIYPGNVLYDQIKNNSITAGDKLAIDNTLTDFNYLGFETDTDDMYMPVIDVRQYQDESLTIPSEHYVLPDAEDITADGQHCFDENGEEYKDGLCVFSDHNTIKESVEIIDNSMSADKREFKISAQNTNKIQVGQYLVAQYKYASGETEKVLTRVINKVKKVNPETNKVEYLISVNEPLMVVDGNKVQRYLDINDESFTTDLQFTKLSGFTLTSYHLPNDTDEQLNKILSVIENTNVGKTLADNDIIQFRYIVDTFDGGIDYMMGPKVILSRLAMNKQKCMALLNAPSFTKLAASVDPRFTEEPDPENGNPKPVISCEYISTGGNLSLGPAKRLTFPDTDNGAKYTGVFTPFIKIVEHNKTKMIPPAADVSNNFMTKFKSGNQFTITAGPRRGIISNAQMSGLEYDLLKEERAYLEPVGFNCLINTKLYGPMIYGDATAYQKTLSALNNLHVRDLLITIESDIEDILSGYVFEFNDAATRLELKSKVETYLRNIKSNQAIYDYSVIMDSTNNTNEIIDQNIAIMDIGIEPVRGMNKIINRVTVLKTGTISSGGFTIS